MARKVLKTRDDGRVLGLELQIALQPRVHRDDEGSRRGVTDRCFAY